MGNISRRNQRWNSPFPPSCKDVCTESIREAHLEASQMRSNPRHGPGIGFDTDNSLTLPFLSTTQVKTLLKAGIWPSPVAP